MEFVLLALVIITIFGIDRIVCRELKKKTDILASGKEGEVFSTPTFIKERISEERKKQFKGVWDAKKLFRELLDITQSVEGWQIDFDKTNHSICYTTKCERVISVINAFNSRKGIEAKRKPISLHNLISKTYSDEKKFELISSIKELLPKLEDERIENIFSPQREFLSRMQLFGILYSYRFDTYKFSSRWRNANDSDIAGELATDITRKFYNESMDSINETILDKLLLLLLGYETDKCFTEMELLEDYGYPNVSDRDIRRMYFYWRDDVRRYDTRNVREDMPLSDEDHNSIKTKNDE